MAREPIELLHAHGEDRPVRRGIVEGVPRPRRSLEPCGRLGVESPQHFVWQQLRETRVEIVGGDLGERRTADNEGREPLPDLRRKRRVGKIEPLLALRAAQKGDAVAQLQLRLCPGQTRHAKTCDALREQERVFLRGLDRQILLAQPDRAEAPIAAAAQARACGVENSFVARIDTVRRDRLNFFRAQRAGGENARLRRAPDNLRNREKGRAR